MIIAMINDVEGALYKITSYREERWEFYANGLCYQYVKMLKIMKDMMYSLFKDLSTDIDVPTSRSYIPILTSL